MKRGGGRDRRAAVSTCVLRLALVTAPCAATVRAADAGFPRPPPGVPPHPGAAEAPACDPATYPDEAGFQRRAKLARAGLVTQDLGTYRRGYFSGGDPGKYVPGHAMARLIEDPQDAEARRYMNDERSYKEHYHFAAVNWARFLPMFGEVALSEETRQRVAAEAARYPYLASGGTENHRAMWLTSANVLPWYTGQGLGHQPKEAALAAAKQKLRDYVKGLFMAGQGEWDSSTYLMFDLNGMLNVYDFAKDEECRRLAAAALDWYAAAYALKYTDGVYCAPNQRGFAGGAVRTIADETGWLWWDSRRALTAEDTKGFRYTLHAQTSSWRPNAVLTRLARRELPRLPVEQRNSKPNYWFGQQLPWKANAYQESVWIAPSYTMGSLWRGHGSQITRFQVAVSTEQGGVVFAGGSPRCSDHVGAKTGIGFRDGAGRYDQAAQADGLYVSMSRCPDDDAEARFSYLALPDSVKPSRHGAWTVLEAGRAFLGLRALGGEARESVLPLSAKQEAENADAAARGQPPRHAARPLLRIDGDRTGFVLQTADAAQVRDRAGFAALLDRVRVDDAAFAADMAVTVSLADGRALGMRFDPDPAGDNHGDRRARVTLDGKPVGVDDWPIYSGPYVRQEPGVLTVTDGREGYVVDFTGERPVYRAL